MDTATNLIEVNIAALTETSGEQLPSSIINKSQEKPSVIEGSESLEAQTSVVSQDEASLNNQESQSRIELVNELPQNRNQNESNIMQVDNMAPELKKEFAYDIMAIKSEFESKGLGLTNLVDKLVDIVNNAYKLSAKDTPYDDYETRLKGVALIMRAMGIGKPQQIYNVLNMFAKPPQIN